MSTTTTHIPNWAPPGSENHRTRTEWTDLWFVPLIGYVNIYMLANGGEYVEDCPGLLMQESTSFTQFWDEPRDDGTGTYRLCEREITTERETQLVPASFDGGMLVSAHEHAEALGIFEACMSRRDYEQEKAEANAEEIG